MARKRLGFWNLAAVLVLGGAIVAFSGSFAMAQEGGGVSMGAGGMITSGKLQFRQYCAQCHGMDATGDGPVAPALKKKPANLTLLSKNNGGVFPEDEVRDFISGTKTSASHGTREMPIWGYAFLRPSKTGMASMGSGTITQAQVDEKINMLVNYVKSVQVK
jgi:mono/diheme cytochrome c family protein